MKILFSALAVAFVAFCIWLAVRLVDRQERWAKRTVATGVVLPVLYVLSLAPSNWLIEHGLVKEKGAIHSTLIAIYAPLDESITYWPRKAKNALSWYVDLWRE
jgi:uncharacterized membrane protein YqjE